MISDAELNDRMTKLFKSNFLEKPDDDDLALSVNQTKALTVMKNSITKRPDNHYEVAVPWVDKHRLPNNYFSAQKVLKNMVQRWEKTRPDILTWYKEKMSELIKNYFIPIAKDECPIESVWHLNHFFYQP